MGPVSQKNRPDSSYPPLEIVFSDPAREHEIVRYANGTCSLRDRGCAQTMHSRVGLEAEARIVYADSARVSERLAKGDLTLWDVGMGTGANVTATLDELRKNYRGQGREGSARLRIESFENDPRGLELALEKIECFPGLIPWAAPLAALVRNGQWEGTIHGPDGHATGVTWVLHVGDFYSRLREAATPDLIYFDFYSPKAHGALWTKEKFRHLRDRLGDHSTELFTYSAATPVRLALLLGGFYVGYGPRTPMKAETTIAATRFESLTLPLEGSWRRKLDLSESIESAADREAARRHPQWSRVSGSPTDSSKPPSPA